MGQALVAAGAVGIAAAGAQHGWKLVKDHYGVARSEPRHAPGNLELLELARELAQVEVTSTNDGIARDSYGGSSASEPSSPYPIADNTTSPGIDFSAPPAPMDPEQERRQKMVMDLRALRQAKAVERQQATQKAEKAKLAVKEKAILEEARRNYPCPDWLTTLGCINVAVTGNSGVGKSSFINSVRGLRARDPNAADVSPNECSMKPTPYQCPGEFAVATKLWDLPGAGTKLFPRDAYLKDMGLRYFDVVIVLTASRYTETEILIAEELAKFKVPFLMVRNKVDFDCVNNEDDHGTLPAETIASIRTDMCRQGVDRPYLISSKFARRLDFDMHQLKADVVKAVCAARDLPQDDGSLANLYEKDWTVASTAGAATAAAGVVC